MENLPAAGRCLAADVMARSGCRLILTCLSMGEAGGAAAEVSLKKKITPREVDRLELQKNLVETDAA